MFIRWLQSRRRWRHSDTTDSSSLMSCHELLTRDSLDQFPVRQTDSFVLYFGIWKRRRIWGQEWHNSRARQVLPAFSNPFREKNWTTAFGINRRTSQRRNGNCLDSTNGLSLYWWPPTGVVSFNLTASDAVTKGNEIFSSFSSSLKRESVGQLSMTFLRNRDGCAVLEHKYWNGGQ